MALAFEAAKRARGYCQVILEARFSECQLSSLKHGNLAGIGFRSGEQGPLRSHGEGDVAASDGEQLHPHLHAEEPQRLAAQPDDAVFGNAHPAVRAPLVRHKLPFRNQIVPQARVIHKDVPQLRRLQQALPRHTEAVSALAAGEQVTLPSQTISYSATACGDSRTARSSRILDFPKTNLLPLFICGIVHAPSRISYSYSASAVTAAHQLP